jgi:hypothetical protein
MDGCYDSPPYRDKVVVICSFSSPLHYVSQLAKRNQIPFFIGVFYFPQMQRSSFVNSLQTVTTPS